MAVANGANSDKNETSFLHGDYLRQLARDLRQLDGKPDCPGTLMDLYFDANITLDTEEDEDKECTDDDMVNVGEEIARFMKELESEYPKYSNEFLDTSLCTVPENELYLPGSGPKENKSEGAHMTVIQNGDEGLPPWLAGPGKRHLEKKGLIPTPTMEVLTVPTMAPSFVPDDRRLGTPTRRPTPAPTPKKKRKKRRRRRRSPRQHLLQHQLQRRRRNAVRRRDTFSSLPALAEHVSLMTVIDVVVLLKLSTKTKRQTTQRKLVNLRVLHHSHAGWQRMVKHTAMKWLTK